MIKSVGGFWGWPDVFFSNFLNLNIFYYFLCFFNEFNKQKYQMVSLAFILNEMKTYESSLLSFSSPYLPHLMSFADLYANWECWKVERAYYPTRIDALVDDDARAMEEINYPISICYVAVDRYSRASLEESEYEIKKRRRN